MSEVSLPSGVLPAAASYASANGGPQRAGAPDSPAPSVNESRDPAPQNNSNEFKVKTDFRSSYAFTYTFFDVKTLELISSWPEVPTYRLAAQRIDPAATLRAIA